MAVTRIWDADNGVWQLVGASAVASLGYTPGNPIYYLANGSFDKANYPGLVAVIADVQGPGGAGGSVAASAAGTAAVAGGGGGGGFASKLIPASALAASEAVVVGLGGAPGAAGANNGNPGSVASSFAGVTGSPGGGGPGAAAAATGWIYEGSGGAATGGDLNLAGAAGGRGIWTGAGVIANLGHGGGSFLGQPMYDWTNSASLSAGPAGRLYGGGGAGAYCAGSGGTPAQAGGAGQPGIVVITPLYATDSVGPPGPKGVMSRNSGPGSQQDVTADLVVATLTITCEAGRLYEVRANAQGTQITNAGNARFRLTGTAGTPTNNLFFKASAVNETIYGSVVALFVPASTGSYTFSVTASSSAAALRVPANGAFIWVEDIGAA